MNIPHFFVLQSRLGLKYPPFGSAELNIGVENGGVGILTKEWLSQFPHHQVSAFEFPSPDQFSDQEYVLQVVEKYQQVSEIIDTTLQQNEMQIVLGGDHSVGFPSLHSVMKREGVRNVGVLMMDSHADLHKVSTSPSGNIHGMWLRMLCGDFDMPGIENIVNPPLQPDQICFIGNLQVEDEESRFLDRHQVKVFSSASLRTDSAMHEIEKFLYKFGHIHLCFDIDVFRQSLVAATGTPNPDGMTKEEIFPLLDIIKKVPSLSIDLVEVNPDKPDAQNTIALAQEVLEKLLKS